ncbi:MAG TPA: transglutaminase-like domain-containing protein [Verrucomicrobiales bacterium]|nr:transglutaminase-like domain-containing protein [Verrucomicrobiales bacterium]
MNCPRALRLLTAFASAFLLCFPALAEESTLPAKKGPPPKLPALELPIPESTFKQTERHWTGIYVNDVKSGWGVDTMGPATVEGKSCVSVTQDMTLEMKAFGSSMKMDTVSRKHYLVEPPCRAFLVEEVQKMNGQERRVVLRHKEGTTYSVEITEAGKTRTDELKNLDLRLCQETTPVVWSTDPARKPGDTFGSVDFSSETLTNSDVTATILKAADWAGPGGKVPVWEMSAYSHGEKVEATIRVSRTDGTIVNALLAQSIELREEPEKVAKFMPGGEQPDLFLALSISTDRKLGNSTALTELTVELSAPAGKQVPDLPDTVNQTVERKPDGSLVIKIKPGGGKPQPASEADRAEALKATFRYPIGEESIKKLAEKAVAGATGERSKVEKILRYTDFYIRDSLDSEPLTVMDLIKSRKGDCSAHALLFTNLARAAGIPAREAGGWMYMGNEYKSFGGHAWNEVILDGHWVPVDPIWTEMSLDAGHIQQSSGESEGSSLQSMVTGMRAKVVSFKKK